MNELWIPIAGILAPATVIALIVWFRYRIRQDMQQTIRLALDKGQELRPELVDRLGHPKPTKDRDLRLGVIWLAVAAALAIFGQVIPDEEANSIFWGISAFPLFIGLAYVIIWRVAERD